MLRRALAHTAPVVTSRVDHAGALLVAGLVAMLWATHRDASTAVSVAAAVLAASIGLARLWIERRAVDPIVPLALFGNAGFAAVATYSALNGVVLFGTVVFLLT